ncbi:SagB/ThcOx family dehydrogenase [Streptomyces sp. NPDC005529]|uniref:SagB/ThcOx family dehydrogenase n=1 Tax=unclassified Streptomyces TaxID=2593676 RepID=UPI0033A242A1
MSIQASEFIRLTPARGAAERWTVDDLLARRSFKLGAQEAALLVLANRPQERLHLIREAAAELTLTTERAETLVAALERVELIVDDAYVATQRYRWAKELSRRWEEKGWRMAAEYHIASHDFPGIDYSKGVAVDRERVHRYRDEEPDDDRFKPPASDDLTPLPPLTAELAPIPVATNAGRTRRLGKTELLSIAALSLGIVETTQSRSAGSADYLTRTSPSGGRRHPTEGYLAVLDVDGIQPGWYHVHGALHALVRLPVPSPDPHSQQFREVFRASTTRAAFEVRCLLVLTSVFGRNMWRYREPRTYRSIHMDVGHITSTVTQLAEGFGIPAFPAYGDLESGVEAMLGLDGLAEGLIATVALG